MNSSCDPAESHGRQATVRLARGTALHRIWRRSAVTDLARTPPRGLRSLLVTVLVLGVACVLAVVLPVPSPSHMRDWSQSVGIAAPLLFLLGHTLATVAPVPRTVFTLAAGLLFGPVLGVALSLVASLRLIPAVPFSVLNYCCALSSIRFHHYLAGTVGVLPGTVAVVVLGDALTGTTSPALLMVSLTGAAIGMIGLIVEARSPVSVAKAKAAF
jgi:uncharacterized membrane protein YdjX (TVP38/TMEM64 family)